MSGALSSIRRSFVGLIVLQLSHYPRLIDHGIVVCIITVFVEVLEMITNVVSDFTLPLCMRRVPGLVEK